MPIRSYLCLFVDKNSRLSLLPSLLSLLLLTAFLRLHRLADLPPGWRDDEVVETLVHAQVVLDGQFPLYFSQAEGHEPLYHYLSAGMIALGGRSLFVVRLLSAFFGCLSIAATYRLARHWFGARVALLCALTLSLSFWSLMYSRFKLRQISEVALMVLTFDLFLWPLIATRLRRAYLRRPAWQYAIGAGVCLALTLHTYYAARTVPAMLVTFIVYLSVFHPALARTHWRSWALTLGVAGLLTAPLMWAIVHTPGGEARLSIVGQPLHALLAGDPSYVFKNITETLGMLAFTGDPEALYNVPHRPLFDALGATLALLGIFVCVWRWRDPRYALVLIWALGGLGPAFLSVPSASLGHTIAAQPAIYLFPALALENLFFNREDAKSAKEKQTWRSSRLRGLVSSAWFKLALSVAFILSLAYRDLRDYFVVWPQLAEVRYLYRAEQYEAARWLRAHPPTTPNIALASRQLHQADVAAFQLAAVGLNVQPRLFQPDTVWLFPGQEAQAVLLQSASGAGSFGLGELAESFAVRPTQLHVVPETPLTAEFTNGWQLYGYTLTHDAQPPTLRLYTFWRIAADYAPPEARPLANLSGAPIVWKIFTHLLSPEGAYLVGDDRLDLDPATLRAGDEFIHQFLISVPDLPPGAYPLNIGLYVPETGERWLLPNGADHLPLTTITIGP